MYLMLNSQETLLQVFILSMLTLIHFHFSKMLETIQNCSNQSRLNKFNSLAVIVFRLIKPICLTKIFFIITNFIRREQDIVQS